MFNFISTRIKLTRHCGLWAQSSSRSILFAGDQAAASRVQSKELRSTSGDDAISSSFQLLGPSPRSLAMLPMKEPLSSSSDTDSGSAHIQSCTASPEAPYQQGQSSALSNSLVIGHFLFWWIIFWIGFQFPKADFSLIFSRNEDFVDLIWQVTEPLTDGVSFEAASRSSECDLLVLCSLEQGKGTSFSAAFSFLEVNSDAQRHNRSLHALTKI